MKTTGIEFFQDLSNVFSGEAAAMYQLVDRLGMTESAKKVGLDTSPQKEKMTKKLIDLVTKRDDAQSKRLLDTLNTNGTNLNIGEMRALALDICNQDVTAFMENHPKINDKMKSIINS